MSQKRSDIWSLFLHFLEPCDPKCDFFICSVFLPFGLALIWPWDSGKCGFSKRVPFPFKLHKEIYQSFEKEDKSHIYTVSLLVKYKRCVLSLSLERRAKIWNVLYRRKWEIFYQLYPYKLLSKSKGRWDVLFVFMQINISVCLCFYWNHFGKLIGFPLKITTNNYSDVLFGK